MNRLQSDLSAKQYLSALKDCRSDCFPLFCEGVTGRVIGPFFSFAYYSPYEWNRRVTHECNRAWGYVRETDGKTQIYFIRGKGLLTPFWVLLLWLVCYLFFLFSSAGDPLVTTEPVFLWISLGISLFACLMSSIGSFFTDAGIAGEDEIIRILQRPQDYYG